VRIRILEEPGTCQLVQHRYYGTDRAGPPHLEVEHASRAVELWDWYVNLAYDGRFLNETGLDKAKELVSEYRQLGIMLQLVESAPTEEALQLGHFIGYDIAFRGYTLSPLSWGLAFGEMPSGSRWKPIGPVLQLIQRYFQPKLNEYGLLSDRAIAQFLYDVLLAVDRYCPGYLESDLDQFEIVALGIVDP